MEAWLYCWTGCEGIEKVVCSAPGLQVHADIVRVRGAAGVDRRDHPGVGGVVVVSTVALPGDGDRGGPGRGGEVQPARGGRLFVADDVAV